LSVLVGIVASFFSLFATVPQVTRAVRTRSAEGVSWSSVVLSLATFTLWCVYAVAVADEIQLVNNTLALVLLVVLAVVLVRAGGCPGLWPAFGAILGAGVLSVLLLDISNAFTLAMVGTTISSMRMLPQARLALSRAPLWGLDPWATVLAWVGCVLWFTYSILVGDHALLLCSAIGTSMQSLVLAFRLPPRRTLASLAGGRLGPRVARLLVPVSARFPQRGDDYELAA
jgi:MtN3 and saliva related transmembrane protein